ncbi:Predicted Zn-dependent peptidase [Sphingopyxis sp. YR583]|uniref:insulinase family protein n=1 Tax=Sphingopyxis sp. YR583 TaxID=1881047 RepID=UPI0008A8119C|nr:insulinase family protein [Sphingopyxis sp. YR583]SEH12617.1 Predicted Zn-dependent peptidase [Sphingopyxis sp. YR583]
MKRFFLAMLLSALTPLQAAVAYKDARKAEGDTAQEISNERRVGLLANGFQYVVERTKGDGQEVTIKLVVRAGTNSEDVNEAGFAHWVEHAVAAPPEGVTRRDTLRFLERASPSFTAQTSSTHAHYTLRFQSKNPEDLDRAIDEIYRMASVRLTDETIAAERNPVLREMSGLPNEVTNRNREVARQIFGSQYFERVLASRERTINGRPEDVRAFHNRWYRPDRMMLIVAGAVDVNRTRVEIEKRFGSLPKPLVHLVEPDFPLHFSDHPRVLNIDPNIAPTPQWQLVNLIPDVGEIDSDSLRSWAITAIIKEAMLNRSSYLNYSGATKSSITYYDPIEYDLNYHAAGVVANIDATSSDAAIKDLEATITALAQLRLYGFGANEFERARQKARLYATLVVSESASLSTEYASDFSEGRSFRPMASNDNKIAALTSVSLSDVNDRVGEILGPESALYLAASSGDAEDLRSAEGILRVGLPREAPALGKIPYVASIAEPVPAAKVRSIARQADGAAEIFEIHGGPRIIFVRSSEGGQAPTVRLAVFDFSTGPGQSLSVSPHRRNLYADINFHPVGADRWASEQFSRDRNFQASAIIGEGYAALDVMVARENAEAAFQFIRAILTSRRPKDEILFADVNGEDRGDRRCESFLGRSAGPQDVVALKRYVTSVQASSILVVGNLPTDEVETLIRSYFGDLKVSRQPAVQRPQTDPSIAQACDFVPTGPNLSATRRFLFQSDVADNMKNRMIVAILGEIARARFSQRLRTDLSISYYQSAGGSVSDIGRRDGIGKARISANFDADVKQFEKAKKEANGIFSSLALGVIEESEIDDATAIVRSKISSLSNTGEQFRCMKSLLVNHSLGTCDASDQRKILDAIVKDDLLGLAKKIFGQPVYVVQKNNEDS